MDRRVARTRATLQRALNSLILKKGYEAITIEEICETANVGRSTFYAHYTSKDDLKRNSLEHLHRLLRDHQKDALAALENASNRSLAFSLPMFEHARDHIDLYRALVGNRGGAVALGTIRQILSDLVRDELRADASKNPNRAIPSELVVHYIVGAYMAVLTWWLDGGAKLPPRQMDAMFRQLATEGIGSCMADLARRVSALVSVAGCLMRARRSDGLWNDRKEIEALIAHIFAHVAPGSDPIRRAGGPAVFGHPPI